MLAGIERHIKLRASRRLGYGGPKVAHTENCDADETNESLH
jgi:hypothetical protein